MEERKKDKPPEGLSYLVSDDVIRGAPLTPLLPSFRFQGVPFPAFEAVSPGISLAACLDTAFEKARERICVSLGQHLSGVISLSDDNRRKSKVELLIATIAENMNCAGQNKDVSTALVTVDLGELDRLVEKLDAEMKEALSAHNYNRMGSLGNVLQKFSQDVKLFKEVNGELDKCREPVLLIRSAFESCQANVISLTEEAAPGVLHAVAELSRCLLKDITPALDAIRLLVKEDQRLRGWEGEHEVLKLVEATSARVTTGIKRVVLEAQALERSAATAQSDGESALALVGGALDHVEGVLRQQIPHALQEDARAWSQDSLQSAVQARIPPPLVHRWLLWDETCSV